MPKVPTSFPTLQTPSGYPQFRTLITNILTAFQRIAGAINNPDFGTTASRPTQQLVTGQTYFDTTINKPIWWNGSTSHWVDATGTNV